MQYKETNHAEGISKDKKIYQAPSQQKARSFKKQLCWFYSQIFYVQN